jgi:hypothetical protein
MKFFINRDLKLQSGFMFIIISCIDSCFLMAKRSRQFVCLRFVCVLLLAISCTKKPNLPGLDLEAWKKDRGGCLGQRFEQVSKLKELKQELKGTSSSDITALFGAPDIHRLSERNQEYYIYFLEKGPHCGQLRPVSNSKSVIFRFSAIKIVSEITFQNGSL